MQLHLADIATVANCIILLGIYGKLRIIGYQHKLMWTDFAKRKGLEYPESAKAARAGGHD